MIVFSNRFPFIHLSNGGLVKVAGKIWLLPSRIKEENIAYISIRGVSP